MRVFALTSGQTPQLLADQPVLNRFDEAIAAAGELERALEWPPPEFTAPMDFANHDFV